MSREWSEVPGVRLIHGDCLDVMPTLDAESIDAVVTDPPYGLAFMGRAWDHGVPGAEFWREALRVAKPGAHLVAFGGTRTFHRLTCAIEDAGWEIRDTLMWLYGTGFPKSHDVSKAIDKEAGAEREVVGTGKRSQNRSEGWDRPWQREQMQGIGGNGMAEFAVTAPATPEAAHWQGWGTALKPAWEPIVLARKPLDGTVASNVLTHGTGGINVDACRIGTTVETWPKSRAWPTDSRDLHAKYVGSGTITVSAGAAPAGRWPANLILSHHPDCNGACDPECPVRLLGEQSGERRTARGEIRGNGKMGYGGDKPGCVTHRFGDVGTAARFYYTPKASKADRCEYNTHPTVKPRAVMEWLIRLVCPPGGTVLDPFVGSGTTALSAQGLGMKCVGIERDPGYFGIARRRVQEAAAGTPLFV